MERYMCTFSATSVSAKFRFGLEMPIGIRIFGIPNNPNKSGIFEYWFGIGTDNNFFSDNFGQTQLPSNFLRKTGKFNVHCQKTLVMS